MKTIYTILLLAAIFVPVARGQNPLVAGQAPVFEAGIGYSYTDVSIPSQSTLGMNGVDLLGTADFSRHFGIHLDLGYARNFNAFNSSHTADLLTYMGGPAFYPLRKRHLNVYTHVLFGGARETGVNYESDGTVLTGYVNKFAWAAGGGVQYRFSRPFALRIGVDYLHTQFFNSNIVVQGQSNLKSGVSLIYTFGEGREH
ncbi:MAG TPA: outer membrane beta-barrel protein [Verrucomicrobiae bacterium]|nr:outer membrane beta-barrel protein [Verrucomicrobiae bacterium]